MYALVEFFGGPLDGIIERVPLFCIHDGATGRLKTVPFTKASETHTYWYEFKRDQAGQIIADFQRQVPKAPDSLGQS